MLHIVNGDSVGEKLGQFVEDEVLVWREIYSAGPVFANPDGSWERAERAAALESMLGIPSREYLKSCEEQERRLADPGRFHEVTLWFEHDLFDQSMLAYLLQRFGKQELGDTRVNLICIGEFPGVEPFHGLGQLTAEQLRSLRGGWRNVERRDLALADELWQAYASDNPLALAGLLERRRDDLAVSGLSFAYDAFRAHLSRLPSVRNGLGIVERTALEALRNGAGTPLQLFREVTDTLHVLGMGDLEFWRVLNVLSREPNPLLRLQTGVPLFGTPPIDGFLGSRVDLTELGSELLEGSADRVRVQGIDEWYGGLHLKGHEVEWRWDEGTGKPIRCQ